MELTKLQRDIMEHTVKGPGRNWFGTSYGCKDSDAFEELVKAGLVTVMIPKLASIWIAHPMPGINDLRIDLDNGKHFSIRFQDGDSLNVVVMQLRAATGLTDAHLTDAHLEEKTLG